MKREKLVLTKDEARMIVYEDHADFIVVSDDIVSTTRWSEIHDIVIQQIHNGKFFKGEYSTGATEEQDEQPFSYDDPDFLEVVAMEKTVTYYGWEHNDE